LLVQVRGKHLDVGRQAFPGFSLLEQQHEHGIGFLAGGAADAPHADHVGTWTDDCKCNGTCLDCRITAAETAERLITGDVKPRYVFARQIQARDIAQELGATVGDDGQTLTRHGVNFLLSWHRPRGNYRTTEAQPDRLSVTGLWPKHRTGSIRDDGGSTASIECSSAKPARTIARDIERRLLREFSKRHAKAVEIILAEHKEADDRDAATKALVAAIPGASIRSAYRDNCVVIPVGNTTTMEFHVNGPTEVYTSGFSCTPEQAAAIAAVLKP